MRADGSQGNPMDGRKENCGCESLLKTWKMMIGYVCVLGVWSNGLMDECIQGHSRTALKMGL